MASSITSLTPTTERTTPGALDSGVGFVVWMPLGAMGLGSVLLAIAATVGGRLVDTMRHSAQVVRVDASSVTAQVVNLVALWDGAYKKLVGKAVGLVAGTPTAIRPTAYREGSVAVWLDEGCPVPTGVGLGNLREKAVSNRNTNLMRSTTWHSTSPSVYMSSLAQQVVS